MPNRKQKSILVSMGVLALASLKSYAVFGQVDIDKFIEACKSGKECILEEVIKNDGDINFRDEQGRTLLHIAAQEGGANIFRFILNHCNNKEFINAKDTSGATAFYYAIKRENLDIIDILLENGIDPNQEDKDGNMPLYCAIDQGNEDIVKHLLAHKGIDVNKLSKDGKTPLLCAIDKENEEIIKCLAEHERIYINHCGSGRKTPLHSAVKKGNIKIVECLLTYVSGVRYGRDGERILRCAVRRGNVEILNSLLRVCAVDVNQYSNFRDTLLNYAIEKGNVDSVRCLLGYGNTDVNCAGKAGKRPIHLAAIKGNVEILNLLLNHPDIDVNSIRGNRDTPLHCAIKKGNVEVLNILLDHPNIDVNKDGNYEDTPLVCAVRLENLEILDILLCHPKIEVNNTIKDESAALHFAAECGRASIVRRLLAHKDIDANLVNRHGYTALHIATTMGHNAVFQVLFNNPLVKVDARTRDEGSTVLHSAVKSNNYYAIGLLLKNSSVNINSLDNDGNNVLYYAIKNLNMVEDFAKRPEINIKHVNKKGCTLLHIAAEHSNTTVVEYLLSQGIFDINQKDNQGMTAIHHAACGGKIKTIKLLLEYDNIDLCPDNDGRTPLHHAACHDVCRDILLGLNPKGTDVTKYFINNPYINVNDKDKWGNTALHLVASNVYRCEDTIKTLLSKDNILVNEPNKFGLTPLHIAALYDSERAVRCLTGDFRVDVGAKVFYNNLESEINTKKAYDYMFNVKVQSELCRRKMQSGLCSYDTEVPNGSTALHIAAYKPGLCCAEILCKYFNSLNEITDDGSTVLHIAAIHRHILEEKDDIKSWLVADVNAKDIYKRTVLHMAAARDNNEYIKYLINNKDFDLDAQDIYGRTALHIAVMFKNKRNVERLVRKSGINLNVRDNEGNTALDLAVNNGGEGLVFTILSSDRMNIENEEASYLLDIAEKKGYRGIASLLKSHIERKLNV